MIILMKAEATPEQIEAVCQAIRDQSLEPLVMPGQGSVAIGIPNSLDQRNRPQLDALLSAYDGVGRVMHVSRAYKLASREFQREPTVFTIKGATFGPGYFQIMGGPCSVESYDQYRLSADLVKSAGARILRGGAFKPRTSPYSFQGLQEEGLKIIKQVGDETGLVTITEVMSSEMVDAVAEHVDILQIGARSMQNFPLLIEAGRSQKPIFLKRGPSATIDEFLLAAEYVLNQGNKNVILCERGIVPLDRTYTRNTFDISAIPVLLENSHLPVMADPSHGTGVAKLVAPMAKASMIAGAHGVMIEMHPNPKAALSDGSQALTPERFAALAGELIELAKFLGIQT